MKEKGCDAGAKVEREFSFDIPMKWKQGGKNGEETPFLGNWLGEVFAIGYTLGVYVKFDGWKETG